MIDTVIVWAVVVTGALTVAAIFLLEESPAARTAEDRGCVIARYDVCVKSGQDMGRCATFAEQVCR